MANMSDFLTGSLGGGGAGAGTAAGIATATGATLGGPMAWGLIGGGALLGGLGSMFEEDDPMAGINRRSGQLQNQMMEEQLEELRKGKRRTRRTESMFSNNMKSFFRGANIRTSAQKLEGVI